MRDSTCFVLFKWRKDNPKYESFSNSPFFKGDDAIYCEWCGDATMYWKFSFKDKIHIEYQILLSEVDVIEIIPHSGAIESYNTRYNTDIMPFIKGLELRYNK